MRVIKLAWRLVVDMATGLILFAVLTAAAIGAHYIADWGQAAGLDRVLVVGLRAVEILLAAADALAVVSVIIYATWTFLRHMRSGS